MPIESDLGKRARSKISPHPKGGITAYLENGGTIENAQAIAAHESPRTTKLYDRTSDEITLDEYVFGALVFSPPKADARH